MTTNVQPDRVIILDRKTHDTPVRWWELSLHRTATDLIQLGYKYGWSMGSFILVSTKKVEYYHGEMVFLKATNRTWGNDGRLPIYAVVEVK